MISWEISCAALILAVVIIRAVFRKKLGASARYALWAVVLLRLLVPFGIGELTLSPATAADGLRGRLESSYLETPLTSTVTFPSREQYSEYIEYIEENPTYSLTGRRNAGVIGAMARTSVPSAGAEGQGPGSVTTITVTVPVSVRWGKLLLYIWLAGAAVTAAWFIAANIKFGSGIRLGRRRADIDAPVWVFVSPLTQTPCLFGLFRPAVYLPEEIEKNETACRHSIAHELTHLKHLDHVWSYLRCLCVALHWFDPLVWLAAVLSRRDAELCCDEGTVKRLGEGERIEYGRTLIEMTSCGRMRIAHAATMMTESKASLRERIVMIAQKRKTAALTIVIVALLLVFAASCSFAGAKRANTGSAGEQTGGQSAGTEAAAQGRGAQSQGSDAQTQGSDAQTQSGAPDAQSAEGAVSGNTDALTPPDVYTKLFESGAPSLTLYRAQYGAFKTYDMPGDYFRGRTGVLLGSYEYTQLSAPAPEPAQYYLTLSGGGAEMTFYALGDNKTLVQYSSSDGSLYWTARSEEGDISLAYDMRFEFDNADADISRIEFFTDTAEDAADQFVHSVYGTHELSLDPEGIYAITEYDVVDWEIREKSADGNALVGWFKAAVKPADINSPGLWAGNTAMGEGDYAGMLVYYREFVLQRGDDGYWRCVGLGTGGYRLPE